VPRGLRDEPIAIIQNINDASLIGKKRRFWELFWGALAVVEDEPVQTAMIDFGNELRGESPSCESL